MLKFFSVLLVLVFLGLQSHSQEIWQYPYEESFESSLGLWSTDSWEISSKYVSPGYGNNDKRIPEDDYDGNKFALARYSNKRYLQSPWFVLDQVDSAELSFGFHMDGGTNHYLKLFMKINQGSWVQIWSMSGPRGMGWSQSNIQLYELFPDQKDYLRVQFKFESEKPGSFYGDMSFAIDHVEMKNITYNSTPIRQHISFPVESTNDNYSGFSSAEGTGYNGHHSNAFDNNTSTYWRDDENASFIQYNFNDNLMVNLTSYKITVDSYLYGPEDWVLYGSNDGTNWISIETRNGVSWSTGQTREFTLNEPSAAYNRFRIFVSDTYYGKNRMRELDFMGYPTADLPQSVWSLSLNEGLIEYRNGTPEYDTGISKSWLISPMDGSRIVLNFSQFVTRNQADILNIYDGDSFNSQLIGSYSGTDVPPQIVSSGPFLFLEYIRQSGQDLGPGSGLKASYQSSDVLAGIFPWIKLENVGYALQDHKLTVNSTNVNTEHELYVDGSIGAEEIVIEVVGAPDYVFEEDYELKSLDQIQNYIEKEGHLPEIPSAAVMEQEGVGLGEMNMLLLKKIEELTLLMIDLKQDHQHQIDSLKSIIKNIKY